MTNPTPQDRETLAQVYRKNAPKYAEQIIAGDLDETPLMAAITTARLQGRREGLEEAARAFPDELIEALRGLLGQIVQGHMAHNFALSPSTQDAVSAAEAALAKWGER